MSKTASKTNHIWDDQSIELVKKLWAEGVSASIIAARIGGITRSSVLGKVHRLRLPLSRSASKGGGSHKSERLARHRPVRFRPTRVHPEARIRKVAKPLHEVEGQPVIDTPVPAHSTLMIPFDDLQPHSCRYPYGTSNYLFCGKPKERGSYCSEHVAICCAPGSNLRSVGLQRSLMEAA